MSYISSIWSVILDLTASLVSVVLLLTGANIMPSPPVREHKEPPLKRYLPTDESKNLVESTRIRVQTPHSNATFTNPNTENILSLEVNGIISITGSVALKETRYPDLIAYISNTSTGKDPRRVWAPVINGVFNSRISFEDDGLYRVIVYTVSQGENSPENILDFYVKNTKPKNLDYGFAYHPDRFRFTHPNLQDIKTNVPIVNGKVRLAGSIDFGDAKNFFVFTEKIDTKHRNIVGLQMTGDSFDQEIPLTEGNGEYQILVRYRPNSAGDSDIILPQNIIGFRVKNEVEKSLDTAPNESVAMPDLKVDLKNLPRVIPMTIAEKLLNQCSIRFVWSSCSVLLRTEDDSTHELANPHYIQLESALQGTAGKCGKIEYTQSPCDEI